MELLRRSIEHLAAPICTGCGVEMTWSRSVLDVASQTVLHGFGCSRCGRIEEISVPLNASKE